MPQHTLREVHEAGRAIAAGFTDSWTFIRTLGMASPDTETEPLNKSQQLGIGLRTWQPTRANALPDLS